MKDIYEVILFTIKDTVKKKTFIITNIILVLVILIGFNIPNILNFIDFDAEENFSDKVIINDAENIFEDNLNILTEDVYPGGDKITLSFDTLTEKEINALLEDDIYYYVDLKEIDNNLNAEVYYLDEYAYMNAEQIINVINGIYKDIQIMNLNLTEEELASIYSTLNIVDNNLSDSEVSIDAGDIVLGSTLSFLLFFGVYLFAFQVSTAVTVEKTSKIVETLLTSTSSKTIILGKTLGSGLIGICQILFITILSLVSAYLFLPGNTMDIFFEYLDSSYIVYTVSFIYFILGYLLFAFLFALSGSMVNRIEEVQTANMPVNLLTIAAFYLAYFSSLSPDGIFNKVSAYIPLSSPFSMPARYISGLESLTGLLISIGILIVTIIIVANVSIKIYSNAILNNGAKMKLKDLVRMYKQDDNI